MGTPPAAVPRLLALLLGLAGAAAAAPRPASGVLGGSVLFSLDLPRKTMKEIEWSFSSGAGNKILVAEVTPGEFKRPDPRDRFGDRLEIYEMALRIWDLERGDSGIYEARIKLMNPAEVVDQLFNLSLYEPLPEPQIQIQQRSLTGQECNLTLRCQVPPGSAAKVTWQPPARLCGDSQTLCVSLSLPVAASNSSYTCVARSPVQERNVTVQTGEHCQPQGDRDRLRVLVCLALLTLSLGALGVAWVWRKKRRRKAARGGRGSARDGPGRATLAPHRSRDPSPEVLYSEIQRMTPLESQERPQVNHTTIYSLVQV